MAVENRDAATTDPRAPQRVERGRLLAAQEVAGRFYRAQLSTEDGARPARFLARIGVPVDGPWVVGFAPDRSTALVSELLRRGFSAVEIRAAGLTRPGDRGQVIDRFRNRVMVGIRDGPDRDAPVVGFVGYAPPHTGPDVPTCIYSPGSSIYRPQTTLFGIGEQEDRAGRRPIVAAHPLDAIVVSARTAHTASPPLVVAPAGQRLTRRHVELLSEVADLSADVGVTLRTDDEGRRAAEHAHRMLAPVVGGRNVLAASWSTGLEDAGSLAEALVVGRVDHAAEVRKTDAARNAAARAARDLLDGQDPEVGSRVRKYMARRLGAAQPAGDPGQIALDFTAPDPPAQGRPSAAPRRPSVAPERPSAAPDRPAVVSQPPATVPKSVDSVPTSPATGEIVARPPRFRPSGQQDLAPSGVKERIDSNLAAVHALKALEAEQRPATPAEQAIIARWSGWGATPDLFDERPQVRERFRAQREELRALLGPSGYRKAVQTVLNAHYTDAAYVRAIWSAVTRLGFTGGRFLEPGCGSGNFLGFAPEGAKGIGVEQDPTTAAVAKALYPDAQIRAESFADTRVAAGAFDLVVGNVPFGSHKLLDPEHNPGRRHTIHNHFILKSLRLTRPGGLVALITSRYTLDGAGDIANQARAEMAELGDLLGAVRLPTHAHGAAAGTDVVTDLLVFRRRGDGPAQAPDWQRVRRTELPGARAGVEPQTLDVNEYFVEHPEMVLGTPLADIGRYGPELRVRGAEPTAQALAEALDRIVAKPREPERAAAQGVSTQPELERALPREASMWAEREDAATPDASAQAEQEPERAATPEASAETEVVFHDDLAEQEGVFLDLGGGRFAQIRDGRQRTHLPPKTQQAELSALIGLRDTVLALLDEEATHHEDTWRMNELRVALNQRYDSYVKKHGPINRFKVTPGTRMDKSTGEVVETERRTYPRLGGFRDDPFWPYVSALEKFNEDTEEVTKADVLHQRVVAHATPADRAATPDDALVISWDLHNEVRLDEVARLLGLDTEAEARQALGTLVYDEPGTDRLIRRSEYLSGNVRGKLAAATEAAQADPRFNVNVEALTAVVPRDLSPAEIGARLGSPWIDASDVQQFLREVLEDADVTVAYVGARWTVNGGRRGSTQAITTWGTRERCAHDLAQNLLNSQSITITKEGGKDNDATAIAQAKAEQLNLRFRTWLWEDPERASRLARTYNDRFNSLVPQSFDGEHITAPGRSATAYELRPHQMAAIARIRNTPGAGLFHGTGAGKTLEMIVGGMELVRLGLVRKPAFVVPKGVLGQFQREFLQTYPRARVLAVDSEDLQGDKRRQFVARCSTGNWDAIIISHTAFKTIPVSKQARAAYLDTQEQHLQSFLANAEGADGRTVKTIEDQIEKLRERVKELLEKPSDPGVEFERTGIDYLFVDEAQVYKNKMVISSIPELAHPGNQITADLDLKLQYLREKYGRRVVTLATATPIDNSPSEILTLMRYAAPELLAAAELEEDDQFHATFIQPRRRLEMKPDGSGFESRTRHARYVNIPELKLLLRSWADIKLKKDLKLKEPAIEGGREQIVSVPSSQELQELLGDLAMRAKDVLSGGAPPLRMTQSGVEKADNFLWISNDGRLASLDLRLLGLHTDEPQKIDVLAELVAKTYDNTKDDVYYEADGTPEPQRGSLQLLFCDLGVPGRDKEWSLYEALRDELVARGVPRERIRFAQDAKTRRDKAQLQRDAWEGKISVLIGSRAGLGTGVNVQRRVTDVIQVDPTWKLTPLVQSLGRGKRDGNVNATIRHIILVTEGSYDPFLWQKVDDKARFTDQILDPNETVRELDAQGEDDGGQLKPAIIFSVAAGKPELLELNTLEETVAILKLEQKIWHDNQFNYRATVSQGRATLGKLQAELAECDDVLQRARDTSGDAFEMTLDGERFVDRAAAGEALIDRVRRFVDSGQRRLTLGEFANFDLRASLVEESERVSVRLRLVGVPKGSFRIFPHDLPYIRPMRLVGDFERKLAAVARRREDTLKALSGVEANVAHAESRLGKPFPRQQELDEQTARFEALQKQLETVGDKGSEKGVGGGPPRARSERKRGGRTQERAPPERPTPDPAEVIRETRPLVESFRSHVLDLEADALLDAGLLESARQKGIRAFHSDLSDWVDGRLDARWRDDHDWGDDFTRPYRDDGRTGNDVRAYLVARVWTQAREADSNGGLDGSSLAQYAEELGPLAAVIAARARGVAAQFSERDDAEWRQERDQVASVLDNIGTVLERVGSAGGPEARRIADAKVAASQRGCAATGESQQAVVAECHRELVELLRGEWGLHAQGRHPVDGLAYFIDKAGLLVAAERALGRGQGQAARAVTFKPAFLSASRDVKQWRADFPRAFAELEAAALTSQRLLMFARANALDRFRLVADEWIVDKVVEMVSENEGWEPDFFVTFFGQDSGRAATDDMVAHLVERVYERMVGWGSEASVDEAMGPLEPYREVLGDRRCRLLARRALQIVEQETERDEAGWRAEHDRVRTVFDGLDVTEARKALELERQIDAAVDAEDSRQLTSLIEQEWERLGTRGHLDTWLVTHFVPATKFVAAELALAREQAQREAAPDPGAPRAPAPPATARAAGEQAALDPLARALTSMNARFREERDRFHEAFAELEAMALSDPELVDAAGGDPAGFKEGTRRWVETTMRAKDAGGWEPEFCMAYFYVHAADTTRADVDTYIARRVAEHCERTAKPVERRPDDPLRYVRGALGEARCQAIERHADAIVLELDSSDAPGLRLINQQAEHAFDELDRYAGAATLKAEAAARRIAERARELTGQIKVFEARGDPAEVARAEAALQAHERSLAAAIDGEWEMFTQGAHLDLWVTKHRGAVATFVAADRVRAKEREVQADHARNVLEAHLDQLLELEADALTDEEMYEAARHNSLENFRLVSDGWVSRTVAAKELARDSTDSYFWPEYTQVKRFVKEYIADRVWGHCQLEALPVHEPEGHNHLEEHRDVLGEGRCAWVDARADELIEQWDGDPEALQADVHRGRIAFARLDHFEIARSSRLERQKRRAIETARRFLADARTVEAAGDLEQAEVNREFAQARQEELAGVLAEEWPLQPSAHISNWFNDYREAVAASVAAKRILERERDAARVAGATPNPEPPAPPAIEPSAPRVGSPRDRFREAFGELEAEALTDAIADAARDRTFDEFEPIAAAWLENTIVAKQAADEFWEPEFVAAYFQTSPRNNTAAFNEDFAARVWEHKAREAEEVGMDAAETSGHERPEVVEGGSHALPEDAEPVEGVNGYHYAVREDQTTVYGPDNALVATATRVAYELTVGDVDGVRISGYSYTSTDATFALLAARQHRVARLPPEHRDRVRVEIVPDTSAKSGRVVAVFGTDKHNRNDREAVKTQAKLVWSERRQAWVSSRPWTAPTVDEKLARLLAEFARQGRNVVVQNHTPEREAAVDPQALTDDDELAAVHKESQETTGEVEPVSTPATGPFSEPEPAARSYSRTALLVFERRLSDQREMFREAYTELEAQALTSKELREAGRASPRRDFAEIASQWIEDTVRAKAQANEFWERFAPVYFGADVKTRDLINDYLTTRVWEHCAPVSPSAGIDRRDDQLEPYQAILGEYEGILGKPRCAAVARLATKIARDHDGAPRSQGDDVSRAFAELERYAVQETLSLERDIQAAAGAGQTEDLRALIHAEWELLRQGRHLDQWLVSNREVVATFVAAEHARTGEREVETAGAVLQTAADLGVFDRALTSIREPFRSERDQFRSALAELEAAALTEANLTDAARSKPDTFSDVAYRWVNRTVRERESNGWHPEFVQSYLGAYAGDNTRADVNEYITKRVSEHCKRETLLASVDGVARPEQPVDPLGSYRERLGAWRVAAIENRSEEIALRRGGRDDPERLRERASRAFDALSEFGARETWSLERTMQAALEAARRSMGLARALEEHNDHVAAETHRALAAKSSEQVAEAIDAEWERFKEGAHLDIWLARHGEAVAAFVASERALTAEYEAPVREAATVAAEPVREPDLGVGTA